MNEGRDGRTKGRTLWRSNRVGCAILALMVVILVIGTACDEEEAFRSFRSAASDSMQAGVNDIMDGVVDGLFAVIDQGLEDSDGSAATP